MFIKFSNNRAYKAHFFHNAKGSKITGLIFPDMASDGTSVEVAAAFYSFRRISDHCSFLTLRARSGLD